MSLQDLTRMMAGTLPSSWPAFWYSCSSSCPTQSFYCLASGFCLGWTLISSGGYRGATTSESNPSWMPVICTSILGLWVPFSRGVYKNWDLNILEMSFLLNLVILAAATLYAKLAGGNHGAVFYISGTVAFSTFFGIIIYHVYQCLKDSRARRILVRKRNERRRAGQWLAEVRCCCKCGNGRDVAKSCTNSNVR